MKTTAYLLGLTLTLILGISPLVAKTWKAMSYDQLIKDSDIIFTGKVIWINNEPVSSSSKDEATIMASKVLKGTLPDAMVPLVYPGINRGYKTAQGKFKSTRTYDEVFVDIEQEGIWFLKKEGKKYVIDHPSRFKPLFFLPKVEEALRKK